MKQKIEEERQSFLKQKAEEEQKLLQIKQEQEMHLS